MRVATGASSVAELQRCLRVVRSVAARREGQLGERSSNKARSAEARAEIGVLVGVLASLPKYR